MIDKEILKLNKDYVFEEGPHKYYWKGQPVETSVTRFITRYFEEFDTENISRAYALKHGLLQEDVKREWKEAGDVSAMAGTIIHAYLEAAKNNTTVEEDYSKAIEAGIEEQVRERVKILMPKAINFIEDTKDLLTPIATEYTVGLEDKLAGNIDLLAWNNEENEIQIWDYKNVKEMSKSNKWRNCFYPFGGYPDCNFIHYSMQLSTYKALAQRLLGINIGKMKLVHFNYTTKAATYNLFDVIDFSDIMSEELDKLIVKKPKLIQHPAPSLITPSTTKSRNGIIGEVKF